MNEEQRRFMDLVFRAVGAHRRGEASVACPKCDGEILVEEVPELGKTYVGCEQGCTYSRLNQEPWSPGER